MDVFYLLSFFQEKERMERLILQESFFSLLSFVSPKERSKEKEPEIDVRPDFGAP
jgi:hypothetical protein